MILALAACGRSDVHEQPVGPRQLMPPPTMPPPAKVPATLELRVDDFFSVWVNGEHLRTTTELWHTEQKLSLQVECGQNVIALEAKNQWKTDGLDRGAIAHLKVPALGLEVTTDGTWTHGDGAGWTTVAFDDRAWQRAVVIAAHGAPPWGSVLGSSRAQWIWSSAVGGPASGKVEVETVKLRKRFVAACP